MSNELFLLSDHSVVFSDSSERVITDTVISFVRLLYVGDTADVLIHQATVIVQSILF